MTRMPARQAASALLLLLLLALAVLFADDTPGPGPLALCTAVACVHAALLAPSLGAGGWLGLLCCLPALAGTAYGHAGDALAFSLLLVALAAAAGAAGQRAARLYLPYMVLVFAAPYALHYLTVEFGSVAGAEAWRRLSPVAAAEAVAAGAVLPAPCAALLLAWPVGALVRRRR